MKDFEFEKMSIDGVVIIQPFYHEDNRGVFIKDYDSVVFENNGFKDISFKEEFYSRSKKGVVRGLHFQTLKPQSKIVSCIKGAVFDVVVDLRKNSPSFGKYVSVELSEKNHLSIYIPKGCAHGFMALEDDTITYYKCDSEYMKNNDSTIKWNDKDIGIDWPRCLVDKIILSDRDENAMEFISFCSKYGGL